ncbi:MAG: hypothetical protein KKF85_06850 [Gammaproteobacteria bacterium]|nr:hypothetical protein [Gammaproteobacteria bacterium]MBU3989839.1 hypothetical protein [Gammaproteobacteria bacterium]MBU4004375.1 hypothetical protein [Gammaproteobacteria bacterium]MBU4019784.1 hypothetical protein [Gammaproteobacteria bacterium]MBU4097403.1 hypothetical protein [Gammaproteobacteria bacterium]
MKIKQIRPEYVEYIPERLEEGALYISERYRTAVHKCCCGCGQEVVTPLSPAEWSVRRNGNQVSLWPSIGNWSYPCRSHYVIRDNYVLEAKAMTDRQIQQVKVNDRADKAAQIRRTNHANEMAALAPKPSAQITSLQEWQPRMSWLQHLIHWWKSL